MSDWGKSYTIVCDKQSPRAANQGPSLIKISRGHFNIKQQNMGQSKSSSIISALHQMTNDKIGPKYPAQRPPDNTHIIMTKRNPVLLLWCVQSTLGEHSTADNCHVGLTLICRVPGPERWHQTGDMRGLLLVREGDTDGAGDTQDGHWSSWWCLLWLSVISVLMEIPGTNCLRWRDLNNKQINVLHEPWVWPGSQQQCPVAKPRSDEIQTVVQSPDTRVTREPEETGEIKTGNGESGDKQLLDKISSGSQISGYFGMIAGPDLIWVSAKSNLGPLCKYLCLWSIAVLRNYVSHSKKCQLMPSSQQEVPQQHLC